MALSCRDAAMLRSRGFGGCVPSVRPRAGKCPRAGTLLGKLGTQKPLCSHAASQLHVLPSLQSLLLCTSRGKVIFCLKHYFFKFTFLFQKAIGLFCLLGKEGLGLLGEEWEIPVVPLQQSQLGSVAVTSSNLASFT